jgi:hypothetical protein
MQAANHVVKSLFIYLLDGCGVLVPAGPLFGGWLPLAGKQ